MMQNIEYKVASTENEFKQIHHLNYETFVEEIPQHERNEDQLLVDSFHNENTYMIAKLGEEVIGMIAVRAERPFSLDKKMNNLENYFNGAKMPCELRLLSVKRQYRKRTVFFGLIGLLAKYCLEQKYDIAFISGTDRELPLYRKLGFQPFGEMIGTNEAIFQPMKLTKDQFVKATHAFHRILARHEPISFLSGPVQMSNEVKDSIGIPTVSHRSVDFKEQIQNVRQRLCAMTKANYTSVLVGTGTLANDVVAQQIKQIGGTGLILSNGEFGERLIDHAKRLNLSFYKVRKEWDTAITELEVHRLLVENPSIKWIWTVHCETSTGYLYNLKWLKRLALEHNIRLCVDAASSLGVDEVDLSDVYLASGVSGKAIGSYPGLAVIFHSYEPMQSQTIPRYLDLAMYANNDSTPYTHSSNLLHALEVALNQHKFTKDVLMNELREILRKQGWSLLGDQTYSSGILTIEIPTKLSSISVGERLKKLGLMINYESSYLKERNWVQIALMGDVSRVDLLRLSDALKRMKELREI